MTKKPVSEKPGSEKPMSEAALRGAAGKMSELALKTLADIMRGDGPDTVKLAAARELLDRAHGKPKPSAGKAKTKAKVARDPAAGGMTVIVKRFSEVTAQDEAEAAATEALFR